MRMAGLSKISGLPVATIKFYLREGLLPPGERTSPNQATYSEDHVRRLRLIRALTEVGRLSVVDARAVLEAMGQGPLEALATAQVALVQSTGEDSDDDDEWARARLADLIEQMGWSVWPDTALTRHIRDVLITARRTTGLDLVEQWASYAKSADRLAQGDVAMLAAEPDVSTMVEQAVIGTVLGSAYLSALRMLAHQHHSYQRWGAPTDSVSENCRADDHLPTDTVAPDVLPEGVPTA